MPSTGAVTKVQGKDDEHTMDWTGPWTYTSGSTVLPMPRGNYNLVATGRRQGSATEIKSETPFDKVSLVEVTSLRMQAVPLNPALEGNPGPGGGLRIFPEADAPVPTDDIGEKDQVELVATLDPVIPASGARPLPVS
jgi:hypothetical protein